jgi:excisionase family DNA binding protein
MEAAMSLKDEYFTVSQAAKELEVTGQTILRWVKSKKLPAERVGRESLIPKSAVMERKLKDSELLLDDIVSWFLAANNCKLVRDQLGYKVDDRIMVNGADSYTFLVTRKDGSREISEIGPVSLSYNPDTHDIEVKIALEGVKKYTYKEWKKRSKSKKAE